MSRHIIVLVAFFFAHSIQVGEPLPHPYQKINKAQQWLHSQQHDEGHWGEAGNREFLTSAVLLAYISGGTTPDTRELGSS